MSGQELPLLVLYGYVLKEFYVLKWISLAADGAPVLHEEMEPSKANAEKPKADANQASTRQVKPIARLHKILKFRLLSEEEENWPRQLQLQKLTWSSNHNFSSSAPMHIGGKKKCYLRNCFSLSANVYSEEKFIVYEVAWGISLKWKLCGFRMAKPLSNLK